MDFDESGADGSECKIRRLDQEIFQCDDQALEAS